MNTIHFDVNLISKIHYIDLMFEALNEWSQERKDKRNEIR
jgi:hypothetical protein